jgi:ubiquitin thioesterase protein OTUB1
LLLTRLPVPAAIGFSYFETLINGGSQARVNSEIQRLTRLGDYIRNVGGYEPYLYEDFVEETFILLREISATMTEPRQALDILMEKFNDADASNGIIYHLRLLASSWLKGNADAYAPFISGGMSVRDYCENWIDRPGREIEEMGIILLVNVLLKPVGMVLEIAYLDRSPGNQVNVYRFPEEANGQDPASLGPIIYLLYRPDHYDILYHRGAPSPQLDLQVHRVTSFSQHHDIQGTTQNLQTYSAVDMSPLALLPGFSGPQIGAMSPLAVTTAPTIDSYTPSPQSTWMPSPFADTMPQQPLPAPTPLPQVPRQQEHPLRFSAYCVNPDYVDNGPWREQTLTTNLFKNSHFNTAHYNNPNFQPEEYKPEADEGAEKEREPHKGGSRKRGSA